jgi:hypothetical protein
MPNKEVTIAGGPNNTKAMVTGQQELVVRVNSSSAGAFASSGIVKTPTISRPSNTTGTIAAGANAISIANVGAADGTVATVTLKAGETINFDAGANNTLTSIAYVATGTEFLIITIS